MPVTTFGRMALRLIADGYQPIPVQPGTKVPAVSRWQQTPNVKMLSRWVTRYPNAGIGLVCGQVVAVDIDVLDYEAAEQLDNLTTGLLRATPLVRVGRPPKRILVFRVLEPMPTRRVILSVGKLELLAEGSFFVGYGVHPDTGQPYQWLGESSPEFTPVDRIPIVTPLQCENLFEQALSLFPESQNFDEAPPLDGGGTAKRSNCSLIVRCPRTRKVIDGREAYLAHLVFDAWRENQHATAQEVAGRAWSRFQETASLTRPAHGGKRSWCAQDAFRRAKALLRKERAGTIKRIARSRGKLAPDGLTDLSEDECVRFRVHVEDLHRRRRLSLPAWLVSEFMLTRLRGGRSVDTVEFIASRLNLPKQTVQRARRALLEKGLWGTARQLGNRKTSAPYYPSPETLAKLLETQPVSSEGVSDVIPNNRRGTGGEGACEAPGSTASPAGIVEPVTPEIPIQASDAIQFTCLPPACDANELRLALSKWISGPMPEIVRRAYADAKRRRAVREIDIARAVGISREHVANARFETFGLSPEAVARIKFWLLPDEFPIPPDLIPVGDQPRPPHHRRGGKKRPGPMSALPMLRLLRVIEGQGSRGDLFHHPDRDERESDRHRVSRKFG